MERDDYDFVDALEERERESERKRSRKENQLRTGYLDHNPRKITGYMINVLSGHCNNIDLTTQYPQEVENIRNYGIGKKVSQAHTYTFHLI